VTMTTIRMIADDCVV